MKTLGLDIGTTTVSAVVYDSSEGVVDSKTVKNDSFIRGESWERIQDPKIIYEKAFSLVKEFSDLHKDVAALGLTGQMHGILYVNEKGEHVSPLYTWQDGRGNLPWDEKCTMAEHLSQVTGYSLCTGYGAVTHYVNLQKGLVPSDGKKFCTIQDFLAMKFCGLTSPVTDFSNGASLGLFDLAHCCWDEAAITSAGMDVSFFPRLSSRGVVGESSFGFPVCLAMGDNQAAFLGATDGDTRVLLINMGTGGQVALHTNELHGFASLETRPFPTGGWLLVGASLCGGKSYALLENFFRQTVKMVTGKELSAYDAMMSALDEAETASDIPEVSTLFLGTRKNPQLRGSISGITDENFTPRNLILGVMCGMAEELYTGYAEYLHSGGKMPSKMIGSGNGLRKNPHLQKIFEDRFSLPLTLSKNNEEAACGAAIFAGMQVR